MLAPLTGGADGWVIAFALVTGVLLFLRARHPGGTVQRWAVIAPGVLSVVMSVLLLAPAQDVLARVLGFWLPVLVIGAALLVFGELLPGRRLRPYWGRTADIGESLTAVAVLPLLLQVLHVYAMMRGLAG